MVVTLDGLGCDFTSARIPLSGWQRVREALLGCASPECYQDQGRISGALLVVMPTLRIANSRYIFDGETVTLSPSQGVNQLHGGPEGFDKRRWQIVNCERSSGAVCPEFRCDGVIRALR